MNPENPPVIPEVVVSAPPVTVAAEPKRAPRLRRLLIAPVKLLWGMAFCQGVIGSLAVVGWTYRLMQRSVLKQWWARSDRQAGFRTFEDFAAADAATQGHLHWPNWFLVQDFRGAVRRSPDKSFGSRAVHILKSLFVSLWKNVRIGVQAWFNTAVVTMPGCILWAFAWYDGWNNSFNKGYEHAWIGPAIGSLGNVLFIAAMFYLPIAQARQAVTGDWRRFYDFRLVRTLIRRRWPACAGLAMLYAAVSFPIMVLAILPAAFLQMNPALANQTDEQMLQLLRTYFFWAALFVFPAFVALRWVAARIYASAVLRAVQSGTIAEDALGEYEWQALHRLNLLRVQPPPTRHPLVRAITWAGTRAGRVTFGILTAFVWFAFVVQIYILQFFHYLGAMGWLNQPLVQLPWFRHLPDRLSNPWVQVALAAVVVFLAWRLTKLTGWLKSIRNARPASA